MRLSAFSRRAVMSERAAVRWAGILGAAIAICGCTSLTAPDWSLIDCTADSGGSLGAAGSENSSDGGRAGTATVNDAAGEAGTSAGSTGGGSAGGEAG